MTHDCPHCDREVPSRKALEDHIDRSHPDAEDPSDRTWIALGALVVLAVAAVGAAMVFSGDSTADDRFHIEESPHTGDLDAPVKMIAFESPACTSCRLFHIERDGQPSTFSQIHDRYVTTGQVTYVEKFASAGYGWDRVGAQAQKCAWNLGGWEAFHELTQGYYDQRPQISASNADRFALDWAEGSSTVEAQAFASCFDERRHDDEISQDVTDGQVAGARGTPTFIIIAPDGSSEKIVGPQPFNTFAISIENALDKAAEEPTNDANGTDGGDDNESNETQARPTRG